MSLNRTFFVSSSCLFFDNFRILGKEPTGGSQRSLVFGHWFVTLMALGPAEFPDHPPYILMYFLTYSFLYSSLSSNILLRRQLELSSVPTLILCFRLLSRKILHLRCLFDNIKVFPGGRRFTRGPTNFWLIRRGSGWSRCFR